MDGHVKNKRRLSRADQDWPARAQVASRGHTMTKVGKRPHCERRALENNRSAGRTLPRRLSTLASRRASPGDRWRGFEVASPGAETLLCGSNNLKQPFVGCATVFGRIDSYGGTQIEKRLNHEAT